MKKLLGFPEEHGIGKCMILGIGGAQAQSKRHVMNELFKYSTAHIVKDYSGRTINEVCDELGYHLMEKYNKEEETTMKYFVRNEEATSRRRRHSMNDMMFMTPGGLIPVPGHCHQEDEVPEFVPADLEEMKKYIEGVEAHEEHVALKVSSVEIAHARIPDRVIFNEEKRTVALIFVSKTTGRSEAFTSKASDKDIFDPELGYLVAYYHKLSGTSKHRISDEAKHLLRSEPEFLKGALYTKFTQNTGMSLEKAQSYIQRKIKKGYKKLQVEEVESTEE